MEKQEWHHDSPEATLVIATMNWDRYSVRRFENWHLYAGRANQLRGVLEYDEDPFGVVATFGDKELQTAIKHWPWHSYDFDFQSLNFTLRHLIDPLKTFRFGVTDMVRTNSGPTIADKGLVDVVYQSDVERHGPQCRKYSIDGPGLEGQGGTIWVHSTDAVIVDYEIALPDEPGFNSGELRLTHLERMSDREWEAFQSSRDAQ